MKNSLFIKDCRAFLPEEGFVGGMGISISEGKIAGLGKNLKPSADDEVYDARGAFTTPGLVDGHTHLGTAEYAYGEHDGNEKSDPVTPYVQIIDSINPFSGAFRDVLAGGVTTAMVLPGSSNVFGGLGAAVKTGGGNFNKMVLRNPAAMKMALGFNPKSIHGAKDRCPCTRMGSAYLMRRTFTQALEYSERKKQAGSRVPKDIGLENVLKVLSGEIQARIHCHRADDIITALRISDEFGFKCCLDHATEGHLVADELLQRGVPCFLGPNFNVPSKQETLGTGFQNALRLYRAGVEFAIVSDHGVEPSWHLSLYAGLSAREGLPEEAAIKAVTSWPAKIMGLDCMVGMLAAGMDADIVIWDRHPLFMGKPVKVYAGGIPAGQPLKSL